MTTINATVAELMGQFNKVVNAESHLASGPLIWGKAYDEKKERKEIAMAGSRSLASMNTGKFAKITAPTCNVRTFPSADSKVIGAYRQGRKVHVKIHDKSWYTTVYNGEKVFMGAGCFE